MSNSFGVTMVRTAGDPLDVHFLCGAAIARADRDQPVTRIRTMDEVAAESIAEPRFRAQLARTLTRFR